MSSQSPALLVILNVSLLHFQLIDLFRSRIEKKYTKKNLSDNIKFPNPWILNKGYRYVWSLKQTYLSISICCDAYSINFIHINIVYTRPSDLQSNLLKAAHQKLTGWINYVCELQVECVLRQINREFLLDIFTFHALREKKLFREYF